jgi:hypothetical protein
VSVILKNGVSKPRNVLASIRLAEDVELVIGVLRVELEEKGREKVVGIGGNVDFIVGSALWVLDIGKSSADGGVDIKDACVSVPRVRVGLKGAIALNKKVSVFNEGTK